MTQAELHKSSTPLTPRQLRANNAGQRYYTRRFAGTTATQAQLDAAMEQKHRQWQRNHTSLEWQLHFTRGWNAAILGDPTIGRDGEKDQQPRCIPEDPTTDSATYGEADTPLYGPEGNDGGWGSPISGIWHRLVFGPEGGDRPSWARLVFGPEGGGRPGWNKAQVLQILGCGDSDTPVFGPKNGAAPGWSRLLGPEDDRGGGWSLLLTATSATPVFGPKDNGGPGFLPLFGPDGSTKPGCAAFRCTILFAPEGGDGTGWSPILCIPVIFIGILTQCPRLDPEDTDDEVGSYHQIKLGPEDGDETGSHHPIRRDLVMAMRTSKVRIALYKEDDQTRGSRKFGPTGGDDLPFALTGNRATALVEHSHLTNCTGRAL